MKKCHNVPKCDHSGTSTSCHNGLTSVSATQTRSYCINTFTLFVMEVVKRRICYGQADRKRWPPPLPLLMVSFLWFFFGVHLTLEYDYMCSETDSTQESTRIGLGGKVYPIISAPHCLLLLCHKISLMYQRSLFLTNKAWFDIRLLLPIFGLHNSEELSPLL